MANTPLVLAKKIELKVENSILDTIKSIEPLLSAYKGAKIQFKQQNSGKFAEFTIGIGDNLSTASILIKPTSDKTSKMVLGIESTNESSVHDTPDQATKKIDILIEDILIHILPGLEIKEKAKLIEKSKICPHCKLPNEISVKFCVECGFNFVDMAPPLPKLPQRPPESLEEHSPRDHKPLTVEELSKKYPNQYECELCSMRCAYKDPFILLLNDLKNLEEPFKMFDKFLRTKDLVMFSDYIYEYASQQLKAYPNFSKNESTNIFFCIFSILSWHILEKAPQKIRITFAKKMKDRLKARFDGENPQISSGSLMDTEISSPHPTIKTGSLRIEENRCPYCYKKFDEKILKLKIKGYIVECPECGEPL